MDDNRKKHGLNSKPERHSGWIIAAVLVMILIVVMLIGFLTGERYFRDHFSYGTTVNGVSVFRMTEQQVKDQLSQRIDGYTLTIVERAGDGSSDTETITGEDIGLSLTFDDSLTKALENQSRGNWIRSFWEKTELAPETMVTYDGSLWKTVQKQLQCFQSSYIVSPRDAELSDYQEGVGYEIIPEVQGNEPVRKVVVSALAEAFSNLEETVDLTAMEGVYKTPAVLSDDASLLEEKERLEKYTNIKITYTFGDNEEVLDGDTIRKWITVDEEENVTLDENAVSEYVATLRRRYDTIFRTHKFITHDGEEITLEDGDYGWWMNYTQEAKELAEMILIGESGERTPVYYQTAGSYGEYDYGDTYVEVNLTAQHMYFYKDGELSLESDFVSGNSSRNYDTPEGIYGITYKQRNATLVGENYETPVSYWMPFNQNVGLHDATWRTNFGNSIYRTSGSHGCINLPYLVAKKLYSMVEEGTAVICYNLEGTESTSNTTQSNEEIAQSAIDAIDAIGTVNKNSWPKVERARELYDELNSSQRSYVDNYDTLKEAEEEVKQYPKPAETKRNEE